MSLCDAGLMWFLPCSQAPTRLAIQGRTTRFDQLRKVPVCNGHAERIRHMPLWVIRGLDGQAVAE